MMKAITLPDDHDLCIRVMLDRITQIDGDDRLGGVVHVGAHVGEEVAAYRDFGLSPIVLVEPNPTAVKHLRQSLQQPDILIFECAAGASSGETILIEHRTAKGSIESSSQLELEELSGVVTFDSTKRFTIPVKTVDEIAAGIADLRLLVVDVQGTELSVFAGAGDTLKICDFVISEVNLRPNYQGCAMEEDIDKLMANRGFEKVLAIYHELYDSQSRWDAWGECLYRRIS